MYIFQDNFGVRKDPEDGKSSKTKGLSFLLFTVKIKE